MYQVVKYVVLLICGSCDFVNLLKFIVCFDLFFHGLIIISSFTFLWVYCAQLSDSFVPGNVGWTLVLGGLA